MLHEGVLAEAADGEDPPAGVRGGHGVGEAVEDEVVDVEDEEVGVVAEERGGGGGGEVREVVVGLEVGLDHGAVHGVADGDEDI